jgi:hypothetical protein
MKFNIGRTCVKTLKATNSPSSTGRVQGKEPNAMLKAKQVLPRSCRPLACETGSHYVAQASLKHMALLSLPLSTGHTDRRLPAEEMAHLWSLKRLATWRPSRASESLPDLRTSLKERGDPHHSSNAGNKLPLWFSSGPQLALGEDQLLCLCIHSNVSLTH